MGMSPNNGTEQTDYGHTRDEHAGNETVIWIAKKAVADFKV
jgi:hypothetical protein